MILIATDSFKDALSAVDVCQAIEKGIKRAYPDLPTRIFPLADGGEGTAGILSFHRGGIPRRLTVHDPLFRRVEAGYFISEDQQWAFIEMAAASGLPLLEISERDPLKTTTLGTGELIADAIKQGVGEIFLGIGGSATNDAGIGMATALGYEFLDEYGRLLSPVGANLQKIAQIDDQFVIFDRNHIRVKVICDVENPLYGKNGAAYVYGQQKGATSSAVETLDLGLQNFAIVLQEYFGKDFSSIPGAGAAGGMGAGCLAFLNAVLQPGIQTVMALTGFESQMKEADLVLTGEGRIDIQTLQGKLISGITALAKVHHIPVIALCGSLAATPAQIRDLGLEAAFSISPGPGSLEEALKNSARDLEYAAFNIFRTLQIPAIGRKEKK